MDWIQALTNAGTGGILGIAGSVASGWLKIRGLKAQAEIEREMVKLQIDKGTIEADSADFQASQKAAQKESDALISISQIADKPWQRGLLVAPYAIEGQLVAAWHTQIRQQIGQFASRRLGRRYCYAGVPAHGILICANS